MFLKEIRNIFCAWTQLENSLSAENVASTNRETFVFASLVPRRHSLVERGALCAMGLIIHGSK